MNLMNQKYEYGLLLARKNYINLSTAENLFKSKRAFTMFKWDRDAAFKRFKANVKMNENSQTVTIKEYSDIVTGCWRPWLAYAGGKWYNVGKSKKYDVFTDKKVMIPMHMFFETQDDFKQWIGEDMFGKLVIDLL